MTEEERQRYERAITERIEANGGDVEAINVQPRRPGQVLATVKLRGEKAERQGAFSTEDLS